MAENFVLQLEANARRYPRKTVLVWESGALTWSELDSLASGFACRLLGQGVKAGDRVAIMIPNRPDFVIAFLAVLKLGATPAPLNPLIKSEELHAYTEDLKPRLVIDQVRAEPGHFDTVAEPSAPALILYTSGSTGKPKGAQFSHSAVSFASQSWAEPVMRLTAEDIILASLPLAHSLGLKCALLAPLLFGSTIALVERFSPEVVFDAVRRHRVTVLPGVSTLFRRLLNAPALSEADLTSLRLSVSGAAPCPWVLAREWREKTGVRILRGYGMTEVPRPISYDANDPVDVPDSVGKAVPGVELRLEEDYGGGSELLIRSPAAMEGYLDDPKETELVLCEGWIRTGDLATISPDGYVSIVGRKRDRILRGGYSVFPQEVEAVLLAHPAVAEAAVIGIPDPDLGEEVAAFVALKPLARASADELLAHCKERLARYKYPRKLQILKELPKGPTGKILKSELPREEL